MLVCPLSLGNSPRPQNFGDTITIDFDVASEEAFVQFPDLDAQWVSSASGSDPDGWVEFTAGDLSGFFSDSSGYIYDPGSGGGGTPPMIVQATAPVEQRLKAIQAMAGDLDALASATAGQRGYFSCVGSVAATIGGTILGTQQHRQNVRDYRAGRVARGAVRASAVGVGAVVLGGAVVSASVCLAVFLTE